MKMSWDKQMEPRLSKIFIFILSIFISIKEIKNANPVTKKIQREIKKKYLFLDCLTSLA